jgi:nodulation protein E
MKMGIPRRVAVTGVGTVSALGNDCAGFWNSLLAGRCGIRQIESCDTSGIRFQNGAEVRGLELSSHFAPKRLDEIDRFAALALIAAREAVTQAKVHWTPELCERAMVVTGTATGGGLTQDHSYVELYRQGLSRVHPMSIPRIMHSSSTSWISIEYGLKGPAFGIATACASSTHAIGIAFWLVRQGIADLALTGGSESPFNYGHLKAWEALRVVASDTCRPFSQKRGGMVLGEGAAILLLEPLEGALERGAPVLAEVEGFGMSSDAGQLLHPSVEGATRAMKAALADAETVPEGIQLISAHGTGTLANDQVESQAIKSVFGPHTANLKVTATKSAHGHALGAAGALEAVATVLSIRYGRVPPTLNYLGPDAKCQVPLVTEGPTVCQVNRALNNSFAFGGLNASLVFKRFPEASLSSAAAVAQRRNVAEAERGETQERRSG